MTTPPDPVDLLARLDADAIAERLATLEREERALRVLLRAARALEAAAVRRQVAAASKGVPRA